MAQNGPSGFSSADGGDEVLHPKQDYACRNAKVSAFIVS